ncbi:hypothetical protein IJ818_01400 [bacterium]|nr:hypothetical protein [bacterium]
MSTNGVSGVPPKKTAKLYGKYQQATEQPVSIYTDRSVTEQQAVLAQNKKIGKPLVGHNAVRTAAYQATLQAGTLAKYAGLPVAGDLLALSLMSKEERTQAIRERGGQVLTGAAARKKVESLGLKEGTGSHTEPDQMEMETIIFPSGSKETEVCNNNKLLQLKVREWAQNGAPKDAVIGFNTADSGSMDLRLGIGYSNIVGLHISDDGQYAEGFVEDVYDYDPTYNKGKADNGNLFKQARSAAVEKLNDMAVYLQDEGKLQTYRYLVPIKVKIK